MAKLNISEILQITELEERLELTSLPLEISDNDTLRCGSTSSL